MLRVGVVAVLLVVSLVARADDGDGFYAEPSLYWKSGDSRVDLNFSSRYRLESWNAYAMNADSFWGLRDRLKLTYTWREKLQLVGEVQDVRVGSMDSNGTGVLATYRNAAEGDYNAHGTDIHLLWAEFRFTPLASFRVGRQDLKLGPEVNYSETDWRYLKSARLGERLIGSVGFSHEERAADGITVRADFGGHNLFVFAAQPTTGVFEVDEAYRPLHDVTYEGAQWTVKRGTWLPDTELTGFAIAYQDTRKTEDGGIPHGLSLATFGGSALGIYPLAVGALDVLFFGAGQLGSYGTLDHAAWALLGEVGYQLAELPWKPWLRAGVNAASGDSDPNDHDHQTFFNLLPTNHIYYGFADQLALQNVVNPFVQLRLAPHEMLGLNLFVHWFRLTDNHDARYSGTGVYNTQTFGFPAQASRGYTHVGREYDVVATLNPHKALTIEVGWSWFQGGALFDVSPNRGQNLQFGYVQAELRY